VDQVFGHVSGHVARSEFDTPDDVVEVLDSLGRPSSHAEQLRKKSNSVSSSLFMRHACATKLDTAADWKTWVERLGIRMKGLRNIGQLRISLRGDVDPSSLGNRAWEELKPAQPHNAGDVVCIVKSCMADIDPLRAIVLLTEAEAAGIRNGFMQPTGDAARRPLAKTIQAQTQRSRRPKC